MTTASSTPDDRNVCDLGSLEDTPIANVPSEDTNVLSNERQAAQFREVWNASSSAAEEPEEKEKKEEHRETAKQKAQKMIQPDCESSIAHVPGTQDDNTSSSKCDKPSGASGAHDMKIAAKPTLIQGEYHSSTQPPTTSLSSRRVDGVASYTEDVFSEIQPMPASTCASLPGAYAGRQSE
jgi:hypothetical protein